MNDVILSVNGVNVEGVEHGVAVEALKNSGYSVKLVWNDLIMLVLKESQNFFTCYKNWNDMPWMNSKVAILGDGTAWLTKPYLASVADMQGEEWLPPVISDF